MKTPNRPSILILGIIVIAIAAGFARKVNAATDPCEEDRAKFCPTYAADDPRRLYCLKGIETQIKPSCKASLKNVPGTSGEFVEECVADYRKHCSDVEPGQGRILKCLKVNSKNLEFECRKKVSLFPEPR
jgi:hypothetical protein